MIRQNLNISESIDETLVFMNASNLYSLNNFNCASSQYSDCTTTFLFQLYQMSEEAVPRHRFLSLGSFQPIFYFVLGFGLLLLKNPPKKIIT